MDKIWTEEDIKPKANELKSVRQIEEAYRLNLFQAWNKPTKQTRLAFATPTYSDLAGDAMDSPDRETFLWRFLYLALKNLHGSNYKWLPQYQKSGTCVGQGHKLGGDIVMGVNSIVLDHQFLGRSAVCTNYAGGRVEIAGQVGRWDGSNGIYSTSFMTKYGIVLLKDLGLEDDARDTDERLAVSWAASRDGVPSQFETLAKTKPLSSAPLVTTTKEVSKAIQAGHPVTICTNLIPTGRRDSSGFSPVRRSGGHCTLIWGVRFGPDGFLYQNSWSEDWGSGGVYPVDQPPGSVWITPSELQSILNEEDSYALVGMTGLEPLTDDINL